VIRTYCVIRETVNRLDEIVCIACPHGRGDVMASEEAKQEYTNLKKGHCGMIETIIR
jgi:hypothetical protein